MVIFKNLFGQKEEIEKKDFFSYDDISTETRQKIFFIIEENGYYMGFDQRSIKIQKVLFSDLDKLKYQICKYKGIANLNNLGYSKESINEWLKKCSVIDFLRTIEIFLWIKINDKTDDNDKRLARTIKEMNEVFDIDKIGYEIIDNKIIRKDSKYLHKEVIKETISLLYTHDFKGPLEEFEKALEHYLKKDYKTSIAEANKAYESTMKSILTKLKINYSSDDTASTLIKLLYDNDVIFSQTESFTNNLRTILQGLPTIRNKQAGHGQGLNPKEVYKSYTEFALHLCGSFIVFLIHRYEEKVK